MWMDELMDRERERERGVISYLMDRFGLYNNLSIAAGVFVFFPFSFPPIAILCFRPHHTSETSHQSHPPPQKRKYGQSYD